MRNKASGTTGGSDIPKAQRIGSTPCNLPVHFEYLQQSFGEWLDILGYAESTVYYMPRHIREFFYWLTEMGITHVKAISAEHIANYYAYLQNRPNKRRDGGLSQAHLNKHLQALKKFTEYLRKTRNHSCVIELKNFKPEGRITWLTEAEIKLLYEVIQQESNYNSGVFNPALQSRDRAMLTVFYGCGLRRKEGVHLDVGDVNFDRNLLHVRKGKRYKERFVPLSDTGRRYLQEYVYDHRPTLLGHRSGPALFISMFGTRMHGQSLLIRLRHLVGWTGDFTLQHKAIGLHTLRHSIATHLLSAGMRLESISRFLGHSSLESTQVYTHLSAEVLTKEELASHGNPKL